MILNRISFSTGNKSYTNPKTGKESSQAVSFRGKAVVDDTFEFQPAMPQVLTNSKGYKVEIDGAGAGKSIANGAIVMKGSDDPLRNQLGHLFYLREGKNFWSAGLQPTLKKPDKYETNFTDKEAKITRQDGAIQSELKVTVAPEDNAEKRQLSLTNADSKPHDIEVTSYSETALIPNPGHKAFTNLFVETKYNPVIQGIISSRRPRGRDDKQMWSATTIRVNKEAMKKGSSIEYETAREKFIGRTRNLQDPAAMHKKHLSNTAGIPLDPVTSLRTTLHLEPNQKIDVDFVTVVGSTENEVVELAKKVNQESRGI
ncbi:MAG: hypothetical protein WC197_08150 [Candidatus Gastranaerophilaceae bacterium]|jgi:cyclic beta-1,2-glucan synthetase